MATVITRSVTNEKITTTSITVTETDRVVQFDDIFESVTVEYDDCMDEAPWESCDGWEHDYESIGYNHHEGVRESRGAGFSDANREAFVITVSDNQMKEWGNYAYYRNSGCSKQVAAEMVAQIKRDALDQLVKWYSYGWYWYQTGGEYGGYTAGCGGIDCPDHAEEMRYEIADEIAADMEADGYIVEGKHNPHRYSSLDAAKDRYKRNLQFDVVKGR